MKAGWKNRIEERRYFEEKKVAQSRRASENMRVRMAIEWKQAEMAKVEERRGKRVGQI